MTGEEAKILLNVEIKETNKERALDIFHTISGGIVGGGTTSILGILAVLPSMLEGNVNLPYLASIFGMGYITGVITDICLNAEFYDTSTRLKLLKELKNHLEQDCDVFANFKTEDFKQKLKQFK